MTLKPKFTLPIALGLLLVAWLGISILSQREPFYNGKRLSDWARQYGSNNWGTNRIAAKEAETAIQNIGTNGIPYLLDYLQKRDSILKTKLRKVFPRKWHERLRLEDHSGNIRRIGAHGIAALGTNAAAALPALVRIAKHHPDEDGRYIAVFAIRTLGPAAEPAVPFLIQCLTNSVSIIRDDAAIALGDTQLHPEVVLPALAGYVNFAKTSSSPFELRDAVTALARFSPDLALPVLLPMLEDSNAGLRESVTNAIARVNWPSASPRTSLRTADGHFTINHRPTFLLEFSYFAALGAPDDFIRQDLTAFQKRHFNCLRIFATWNAFGTNLSVVNSSGEPRQPFFDKLKWLVELCEHRGIIVDVTLARSKTALPDFNAHRAAVTNLVTSLNAFRNWYFDLANEHDVRDDRFVSDEELKRLCAEVHRLDPQRLVTASFGGHDVSPNEIRTAIQTIGLDFLCPHRLRSPESAAQTFLETTNDLALFKQIDKTVPIHYQEPFRRDYSDWQPSSEDFLTDLRGAIDGGASGWCFHNGAARDSSQGPRRCFDLRTNRLFEQLDPEERKFVDTFADSSPEVPGRTSSSH